MQLEQAHKQIAKAISRKDMLIVVGECYVEYVGRAASKLPRGKRLLLIKGDNSFAIHQNRLLRPTNYMMGARIGCTMGDGALVLTA
ncbi:MAG: endonuclease NucS, partial [archaeon]|nr:endonuclease NucS [archaeon]